MTPEAYKAFILKVLATSIPHLETLIAKLSAYGATSTSIVSSLPVRKNDLDVVA